MIRIILELANMGPEFSLVGLPLGELWFNYYSRILVKMRIEVDDTLLASSMLARVVHNVLYAIVARVVVYNNTN